MTIMRTQLLLLEVSVMASPELCDEGTVSCGENFAKAGNVEVDITCNWLHHFVIISMAAAVGITALFLPRRRFETSQR